jgi:hypothetical protein
MRSQKKISAEASEPVVVVIKTPASDIQRQKRRRMEGVRLHLQARRAVVQQMAPPYRSAPPARKRELLDA